MENSCTQSLLEEAMKETPAISDCNASTLEIPFHSDTSNPASSIHSLNSSREDLCTPTNSGHDSLTYNETHNSFNISDLSTQSSNSLTLSETSCDIKQPSIKEIIQKALCLGYYTLQEQLHPNNRSKEYNTAILKEKVTSAENDLQNAIVFFNTNNDVNIKAIVAGFLKEHGPKESEEL